MNIGEILTGAGLKRTKQREALLELLKNADKPMTAEMIYENTKNMSRSTVYRTLEKFLEKGIVTRGVVHDGDKLYYELACMGHRHYAICLGCHEMRYIDICPMHDAHINNFTVTGHKLELYGYCDKCAAKI